MRIQKFSRKPGRTASRALALVKQIYFVNTLYESREVLFFQVIILISIIIEDYVKGSYVLSYD